MAVYVDSRFWVWKGEEWGHLIGDSLDELHEFASRLGLQFDWFQGASKFPHYDITLKMKAAAISAGAIQLTGRGFVEKARSVSAEKSVQAKQLTLDF